MASPPVHNAQSGPQRWVIWYGGPLYLGQLHLPDVVQAAPIPNIPIGADSLSRNGFYAHPYVEGMGVTQGDPYYSVHQVDSTGKPTKTLGQLVNMLDVDAGVVNDQGALLHPSTLAAAKQWGLENALYGDWVETIRPLQDGDDDDDVETAPDGSQWKTGVLQLTDGRFYMSADHHWHNRNHPGVDLGWAFAPAEEPKHGFAGVINTIGEIISAAGADLLKNPIGAALLVLVLVSAAPLAGLFLPAVQVAVVSAAGIDVATGGDAGALNALGQGAIYVAEHPAEVGTTIAGAELELAGSAVGGKFGSALSGLGQGVMASGLTGLFGDIGAPTIPTVPGPGPAAPNDPGAAWVPWWRFFTNAARSK